MYRDLGMKQFVLFILLILGNIAYAQTYDAAKINTKAVNTYNRAVILLENGELKKALPYLLNAIQLDSNYVEAILSLAGVFGDWKDYKRAVQYYEQAKQKDTSYFKVYNLPYSINLAGTGNFTAALDAINSFLQIDRLSERSIKSALYRKDSYTFAVDYQQKKGNNSYKFNPVNLGDSINTAQSEYYPSITIQDSLLVFTRRGNGIEEDFIESTLQKNNEYSKSKLIEGSINDEPRKGAISVSPDGEWMVFAGNFSGKGLGSFDIYISYWTKQGWSEPINLGDNVNSEFWDSGPSISPDKKAVYFSSNRTGGYGGSDLYVSYIQPNGKFGKAINMGKQFNTNGDEAAPFIHSDNQTLYFTSSGLPGYGASDLFVARKNISGKWNDPENLGYPINTIEHEGSIAVSSDGKNAFYASDRADSKGGLDLYKFELRADIQPYKTSYVKGVVYDAKSNKGIPSAVELIDNENAQALMKVQTDELGNYFITLPTGKEYSFVVNRKGYLYYNDIYDLKDKQSDSTYTKNIPLQPIEINKNVVFRNIQFTTNSYDLLPVSIIELDKLLQVLTENKTLKIEIGGHTDNIGKPEDNLKLSASRAKAVVDYLISKGVEISRLTYKGYGASKPINTNSTEEGRAKNRRTEFTIIGL